jgi:DNA-binding SARP family transcriptional activator
MLEIGVLGPVTARVDGEELGVAGARQRALLIALAVDAGRLVPTDVLVERVWNGDLPARPDNALQQQVLKLRRALGESAVAFEPPGYRLAVEPEAVDATRFEQLVERARGIAGADPQGAEAALAEALALWRGPALAEAAYRDWAAGESARLDELRVQAQELRLEAIVASGRPSEAIGDLEQLVRSEPLRERLWSLLILALYRAGRQADALATFTQARTRLVEDLGVEPSAELRRLHQQVLGQDPALEVASSGARAVALPARPPALPPPLARHLGGAPFVGRGPELELLAASWRRARGGEVTSVLISGPPGAGKTRLAAEHARALADEGARVLYGRADEDVETPYGPLAVALGQLVEVAAPSLLEAHVEAHGGELARLAPQLIARVPDLPPLAEADPDTERLRLRNAVAAFVTEASRREPLAVVLDDLHWADRATLGLLLHLLRGPDARVLVLATYRDTPSDQREPLREALGDFAREPHGVHLEVPALSAEDVVGLLGGLLGRVPDAAETAVGREVHQQTEGNALFATELLRHLADSGEIGAEAMASGVPPTLREVVRQRLERIGVAATAALLPASVLGLAFDVDELAALTGEPDERLAEGLDLALAAGLVDSSPDEPSRFAFSHAVIQATLSESLGPARRRLLHRQRAERLAAREELDPRGLADLAHHWIECGERERGREAAVRAGDAALGMLAADDAARWYARALELLEAEEGADPRARAELLVRLGDAERQAGSEEFREHLLEAGRLARELGDAELLARAALANNRGMHSHTGVIDAERLEQMEAAVEMRPQADGELALLLATISSELWLGERDRRHALSDEALAVARRVGDDRVLAEVIYRRCFATAEPATVAERLELTAELLEITARLGDPLWELLASVERSRAAIESADLAEAVHHAKRQGELAAVCGAAYGRHGAGWAQGWPHALAGRYEEAERCAEAALAESTSSNQPDALAFYGAQIAVIRWDQGRLGELADALVEHAQGPEGLPAHSALAALALVEAGRLDEAGALADAAAAAGFELPVDTIWLAGMVMWGEVCALCGRADAAPALLEKILPWREQVAFTGLAVHGGAARIAAELAALSGRDEEAGELFELAASVHDRLLAPALLTRTHVGWALWLWRRGERESAREHLARATAAAQACGCPHLVERASQIV